MVAHTHSGPRVCLHRERSTKRERESQRCSFVCVRLHTPSNRPRFFVYTTRQQCEFTFLCTHASQRSRLRVCELIFILLRHHRECFKERTPNRIVFKLAQTMGSLPRVVFVAKNLNSLWRQIIVDGSSKKKLIERLTLGVHRNNCFDDKLEPPTHECH